FCSKDPIGYVDGMNLYVGYFANGFLDPDGTCKRRTPEECCKEAWANPQIAIPKGKTKPSAGMVICCDGRKVACARAKGTVEEKEGVDILAECILEHEKDHFDDVPDCDPNDPNITRPDSPEDININFEECKAHLIQLECILSKVGRCNRNAACIDYLKRKAFQITVEMRTRRCRSNYGIEYPEDWRDSF
ncbi:MAG: hypothetical protein MI861_23570, partial [Pirellulales bacterium]|nr:hypothetical protein [Pirellulales bacterium]